MSLRVIPGGRAQDALGGPARPPAPKTAPEHPDEDTWLRLARRALDDEATAHVEAHAASCVECARILNGVRDLQQDTVVSQTVERREAQAARAVADASRPSWLQLVLALVAAAMVVGGGAMMIRTFGRPAVPPVPTAAMAPSPVPPGRQAPRAWAVEAQPPIPALPSQQPGEATAESRRFADDFATAAASLSGGNFATAATAMRELEGRYPARPEPRLYLGIALLFAGDPGEAIVPLEDATGFPPLRQQARWFLAVALERSGQPARADAQLAAACREPGPYRDAACLARSAS